MKDSSSINSREGVRRMSDSIDEGMEFQEKETFDEEFDRFGDVIRVAHLTFCDGVLGKWSYGKVRLAKRKINKFDIQEEEQDEEELEEDATTTTNPHSLFRTPIKTFPPSHKASQQHCAVTTPGRRRQKGRSRHGGLGKSVSEPSGSDFFKGNVDNNNDNNNGDGKAHQSSTSAIPSIPSIRQRFSMLVRSPSGEDSFTPTWHRRGFFQSKYRNSGSEDDYDDEEEQEELVAVKIFRKSILLKMRTMERNKETRKVQIKTALSKVEREIAIMKKLKHPNVIDFKEALDSPASDMLYLVLEYCPLGEIMTYQEDGTFRRNEGDKEAPISGVVDGHFDEETSALFFVDIIHGLAYLHENSIVHRDLKPENILLSLTPDGYPVAKLSDFGVAHMFEDAVPSDGSMSASDTDSQKSAESARQHLERALSMAKKSDSGLLTKTEGTWCFWSPEMCEGQKAFSGYAAVRPVTPTFVVSLFFPAHAFKTVWTHSKDFFYSLCYLQDIWAAGVCLYIFVSGRLPFFSDMPLELMETIAKGNVPFDELKVSDSLLSLLKMTLTKDPGHRAGVGDCLQHEFLQAARKTRISHLSEEFMKSHRKVVVGDDDIRAAFSVVTRIPSVLIKSAAKKVETAGKHLVSLTRMASHSFGSESPSSSRSIVKVQTPENINGFPSLPAIASDDSNADTGTCTGTGIGLASANGRQQKPCGVFRNLYQASSMTHHHHSSRPKVGTPIFRKEPPKDQLPGNAAMVPPDDDNSR